MDCSYIQSGAIKAGMDHTFSDDEIVGENWVAKQGTVAARRFFYPKDPIGQPKEWVGIICN